MKNFKIVFGFSLIEMLVTIFVFSILGIVTTQILALSLRGSKKSESIGEVRSNIEYAVSTMERLLRNAKSVSCASITRLNYVDEHGNAGRFDCVATDGAIASGSASPVRLTSTRVEVLCSGYTVFSCPAPAANVPPSVIIEVRGQDANLGTGVEGSTVSVRTSVMLRTYEF